MSVGNELCPQCGRYNCATCRFNACQGPPPGFFNGGQAPAFGGEKSALQVSNDEQKVREEAERPTEYTMCCSRCSTSVPVLAVANKPKFGEADSYILTGKGTFMRSDEVDRALAAARRAPEGCVIDDKGVVRKVLGALATTKDGVVIGHSGTVYAAFKTKVEPYVTEVKIRKNLYARPQDCYSTRELALAAKGSAGEGEKRA